MYLITITTGSNPSFIWHDSCKQLYFIVLSLCLGVLLAAIRQAGCQVEKNCNKRCIQSCLSKSVSGLSGIAFELENIGESDTLEASTVILERLEKEFYRLDAFAKAL